MNFQDALIPDDEEWARARATAGTGSYTRVRYIPLPCPELDCNTNHWMGFGIFDDMWMVTECPVCTRTKWYKRRSAARP